MSASGGGDGPEPAASNPNIQLPLGPGPEATGTMTVSLAEIEAMGRRAAHGAGLSWGLAEEAGRAARRLAGTGLPGPEALAAALAAIDGQAAAHAPRAEDWQAPAGTLCAVATGAALSDRAEALSQGMRLTLGPVAAPLLVLGVLLAAARDLGAGIALSGGDWRAAALPEGPAFSGPAPARLATLEIGAAHAAPGPARPTGPGPWTLPVAAWRALDIFAHRTYAPASEVSRAAAGAGRDTD